MNSSKIKVQQAIRVNIMKNYQRNLNTIHPRVWALRKLKKSKNTHTHTIKIGIDS